MSNRQGRIVIGCGLVLVAIDLTVIQFRLLRSVRGVHVGSRMLLMGLLTGSTLLVSALALPAALADPTWLTGCETPLVDDHRFGNFGPDYILEVSYPMAIAPSDVDVYLFTYDGYEGRKDGYAPEQNQESLRIEFYLGGVFQGASSGSPDLPDDVDYAEWLGSVGIVELPDGADEVVISHPGKYAGMPQANSIGTHGACLTITDYPPPTTTAPPTTTTTTTTAPTTVAPTTVPPTTAPPTTVAPTTTEVDVVPPTTTVTPTTVPPTTVAPTTTEVDVVPPTTTIAPTTTAAPTTVPPTTVPPTTTTTVSPTTSPPATTVPSTTVPPTTVPSTTVPSTTVPPTPSSTTPATTSTTTSTPAATSTTAPPVTQTVAPTTQPPAAPIKSFGPPPIDRIGTPPSILAYSGSTVVNMATAAWLFVLAGVSLQILLAPQPPRRLAGKSRV